MNKSSFTGLLVLLPLSILLIPLFFRSGSGPADYWNLSILYLYCPLVLMVGSIAIIVKKQRLTISALDVIISLYTTYTLCVALIRSDRIMVNDEIITLILWYCVYLLFKVSFEKNVKTDALMLSITIFGALVGLLGLLQVFGIFRSVHQMNRVTSIFKDSNMFASFLAALLPFAFKMFRQPVKSVQKSFFFKGLAVLYICLCYCFAVMTVSRIAIIIAVAVSLLMVKPLKRFNRLFFMACGSAAIMLFALFLAFAVKTESSSGRILIWKVSSNMISVNPLTGIGHGRFQSEYNNYQSGYFSSGEYKKHELKLAGETFVPFNELLRILIEDGVIGFSLFIMIIVQVLRHLFERKNKLIDEPVIVSILCVFIISLVSFPLQDLVFSLYFYGLLGILSAVSVKKTRWCNNSLWLRIFMVLVMTSASIVFVNRYFVIKKWLDLRVENMLDKRALSAYGNLYGKLSENGLFLIDYGERLFIRGETEKSLAVLNRARSYIPCLALYMRLGVIYKKMDNFQMAEKNYLYACNMVPNRFRPKYALFELYRQSAQREKCIRLGNEIMAMPVKVPSFEIDVIRNEVRRNLDSFPK